MGSLCLPSHREMTSHVLLLLVCTASVHGCCYEREVLGSHASSGLYLLAQDNDTRCSDGCLYTRQGDKQTAYCFQDTQQQVTTCTQTGATDQSTTNNANTDTPSPSSANTDTPSPNTANTDTPSPSSANTATTNPSSANTDTTSPNSANTDTTNPSSA